MRPNVLQIFCIFTKLQHLANAIINAGFVMIQSARVGVGRFAEGVPAGDFPLIVRNSPFLQYWLGLKLRHCVDLVR